MNKRIYILCLSALMALSGYSQLRMRDVFAQLPDSIFPMLTKNNRLDCIDFIENNMEARVKNRVDEYVTLHILTEDYLSLQTSSNASVEMKLVVGKKDTLLCVNTTCRGPVEDSEVVLYDMSWNKQKPVPRPKVKDFLINDTTGLNADTLRMIKEELEYLPLIKASLSQESNEISWIMQIGELSKDIKKVARKYLQPVVAKII